MEIPTWSPTTQVQDSEIQLEDLKISFHRTLRVPDNHDKSKLPPSLGRFPLYETRHYAQSLPPQMARKRGVFLPMYRKCLERKLPMQHWRTMVLTEVIRT
jgi:hypothetical protein